MLRDVTLSFFSDAAYLLLLCRQFNKAEDSSMIFFPDYRMSFVQDVDLILRCSKTSSATIFCKGRSEDVIGLGYSIYV